MSVSRDHYTKLGSERQQERIEAATKLVSELCKEDSTEEWDYALSRLIEGLTTSSQSARYGFSMALTEVVKELVTKENYELSISSFLDKLVEATAVSSSMKGKEMRPTLFGRLFGFQALVNSGLLVEKEHASQEVLEKFVKSIVEIASKRTWLSETAMFTLCQFFGAYLKSKLADDDTTLTFLQIISDEGLMFTSGGLAFVMTIPKADRGRIGSGVTATNQWKHSDPMAKGNLPTLAKILKETETEVDNIEEPSGKAGKKPAKQNPLGSSKLPFVWDLLVAHFAADEVDPGDEPEEEVDSSSKKRKKSSSSSKKKKAKVDSVTEMIALKEFWKVTVDDSLFVEKSSAEQKFWGFEIFNKFVVSLPSSMVQEIFTPNFMRCLINNSAHSNKNLHKMASKTIKKIIEVVQGDLTKVVPCLQAVIDESRGGGWRLDHLSKAKFSDSLIGILNSVEKVDELPSNIVEDLVQGIAGSLIAKFNAGLESQKDVETLGAEDAGKKKTNDLLLKWVLDKIQVLMRSTKKFSVTFNTTKEDIFKLLVQHAFFSCKDSTNVSSNVVKFVQERLNALLSEFIVQKRKDHSWSLYCVKQIEKLEKRDQYELVLDLSNELVLVKEECLESLDSIKKAMKRNPASKNDQYCFELLFSMNLLQLYTGETETVGVLEDLKTSYTEIFGKADEGIDTSVVLTEILLSFVSKKSKLSKNLANLVWESFMCADNADGKLNLTDKCFELLFNVLASKENEEGQKKLFEGEEEFQGDEGSDVDADESDIDSDAHSDSDNKENKPDDGKKSVEMVERETTKKLANALGIKDDYDGEVKFDDIDSDNDDQYASESMDDEQMIAIDGELARIFQERRSALTENSSSKKKSDHTAAKEQMLLFKNRVLDLMESFCKVQQNSVYILSLLQPIALLINTTKNKNLGVKAHKLLKTRICKFKYTDAEVRKVYSTDSEIAEFKNSLLESIKWFQSQAGKYSSNQAHAAACAQACIILSKCLISMDPSSLADIIQIYCATLTIWAAERKNKIQASMFFDFINWLNTKRSNKA